RGVSHQAGVAEDAFAGGEFDVDRRAGFVGVVGNDGADERDVLFAIDTAAVVFAGIVEGDGAVAQRQRARAVDAAGAARAVVRDGALGDGDRAVAGQSARIFAGDVVVNGAALQIRLRRRIGTAGAGQLGDISADRAVGAIQVSRRDARTEDETG